MNQVCYEQQPDFAAIAQHGGALPLDRHAIEQIRRDLAKRRQHYEASRTHLVEEITCEAYALTMLMASHVRAWHPDTEDQDARLDGYLRLAQTFFMIMTLSDLHQAMIGRAKLSVASGVASEKPGDIADMHFRKMASVYVIAEVAMACVSASQWSAAMFEHILAQVVSIIGAQKAAVDALVVIPTTRVVRAQLLAFEQSSRNVHFPSEREEPWRRRLAVMFGEQWPRATFHEDIVRHLVGT
jgi:hypothetical protein